MILKNSKNIDRSNDQVEVKKVERFNKKQNISAYIFGYVQYANIHLLHSIFLLWRSISPLIAFNMPIITINISFAAFNVVLVALIPSLLLVTCKIPLITINITLNLKFKTGNDFESEPKNRKLTIIGNILIYVIA